VISDEYMTTHAAAHMNDIYIAAQRLIADAQIPDDQLAAPRGTYIEVFSHMCWLNNADPERFKMSSQAWVLSPHAYTIYKAKLANRKQIR
jgi:hypothetical protein